ncbi:MAG: two-component regulator propeller domain-containing protein [Bacteroidota bacterium]
MKASKSIYSFNLRTSIGLLLSLAAFLPLSAQSFLVKHFTTDEGLAHNVGFEILQDSAGLIWMGTDNGLCSFDGEVFETYTMDDGLNRNPIITLWQDPQGRLNVGPHRYGINYFEGDSIFKHRVDYSFIRNIKPVYLDEERMLVKDMHPASFGNVFASSLSGPDSIRFTYWILQAKDGVARLEKLNFSKNEILRRRYVIQMLEQLAPAVEARLYQAKDQEIYFLTELGCMRLTDESNMSLSPVFSHILGQSPIKALVEGEKGDFWFASDQHLYHIAQGVLQAKVRIPARLEEILQMQLSSTKGLFLLGTDRQTLFFFDFETGQFTALQDLLKVTAEVSYIFVDRAGNLWLTTMGDGVYLLQQQIVQNFQFDDPGRSFINDISENQAGALWLGSRKGFSVFENGRWTYKAPPNRKNPEISDLYWSKENILLFDHAGSKWTYFPQKNQYRELVKASFDGTGHPQSGGYIWATSSFNSDNGQVGLDLFLSFLNEQKQDSLYYHILPKQGFNLGSSQFLFQERAPDDLWFSLTNGLTQIKGDSIRFWNRQEGLPSEFVNDLVLGPENKLWVATQKGIAVSEGDPIAGFERWEHIREINCSQLIFDRAHNLWIGTQQGLFQWNGKKLTRYSTQSGLISNDINSLHLDRQNRLWIGMSRGVSYIDLKRDFKSPRPPELYIRSLTVDGLAIKNRGSLTLKAKQSIGWEYVGLNFANPEGVEYRYRLSPQEDWQYTQNQSLQLSNLNPGIYQYELQARTERSDWSPSHRASFQVLLPWWQSFWAISLGLILLISLLSLAFYLRIRRIKSREYQKRLQSKRLAELELKALEAQINPHFVFNALNAIQCFILENDADSSHRYLTKFARLMRMFLESSRKSQHLLAEEVEMLKLYIEMEQLCYQGRFTYQIKLPDELHSNNLLVPAMLLQPFVENAIRHGLLHKKEGLGYLSLHFEQKKSLLYCEIRDNGIGRANMKQMQSQTQRSYVSRGMQIVEERIQLQTLLKERPIQIQIDDLHPEQTESPGTKVQIILPLQTVF